MSEVISRRDFLRHSAAGAAAMVSGALPFGSLRAATLPQAQRILIVGAGMAGLGAALELVELGHDVTVLEARLRPGGRVLTLRDAFADGLYADAGAMQVYDSHARVQRRIARFDLELDPIRPGAPGTVLHLMGRRVAMRAGEPSDLPFQLSQSERGLDSGGLWSRYVAPHLAAIRDADTRGALLAEFGTYDRMTFSEFLRAQGASPAAVAILAAGLPIGLGDGADHHSALNLLREAAWRQPHRQSFTIRGGTDRLPKALAARIADRIHYGTPVTRIEQDATGVRAIALQAGTPRTFAADRIVIAIPFAVLRRVQFDPPLPQDKRSAIERLRNTSVVKVFVQTRTRFWIEDGYSGYAATDLPLTMVSERSINQTGTRGLLEAYVAGASARRLCALPEPERLARVLTDLTKIFPRVMDQYESGTSKCWDEDEWAGGAYAWFAPGEMTELLPHIAGNHGRLHFAGDHTSPTPGWMEGALHSAERVVREIGEAEG